MPPAGQVRREPETQTLRSGQLAAQAGVNVETLRYYERRGLLPEPYRRPSGYREYPLDAVDRIRAIKRAQRLGFALAEIEQLLGISGRRPSRDMQATAARKLAELDERLTEIHAMRSELALLLDYECDALVSCQCGRRDCPVDRDAHTLAPPQADVSPSGGRAISPTSFRPSRLTLALAALACIACLLPILATLAGVSFLASASGLGEPLELLFVGAAVVVILLLGRRRSQSCGCSSPQPPRRTDTESVSSPRA